MSTSSQEISVQQIQQQKESLLKIVKPVHLVPEDIKDKRKIFFILQKAGLESCLIKRREVLLNSDQHSNYIKNILKKEPSDYRPDITHQLLLTLHDSPINKAGLMKIYIRTAENHLIEVNASMKIPRTYKRFSLLILQLLRRLRVRAVESSQTLLKVIKNPVTKYLPENAIRFGTSTKGKLVDMNEHVKQINTDEPIVFVIGAVAKGNPAMQVDYIHETLCVSKYPLSAAYATSKILYSFQKKWNLV